MHHNLTEIPFSREDLDVLKTILAETKIDSIVIAVIVVTTLYSGAEYFVQNWKCLLPD